MSVPFHENDLILFIGDSITDCRRDKDVPDTLGMGYAGMVSGRLGLDHAGLNLRFMNRGVNGDRTSDLLARWDRDCIDHQPGWISILAGINNTWRRYDYNDPTPTDAFETEYRELLQRVKDNTSAKTILCSPFLLHINPAIKNMREDLDPKIEAIRKLAGEFDAVWVDFDTAFVAAQQRHIPSYWAGDGIHPSIAGHALMAETWLASVQG